MNWEIIDHNFFVLVNSGLAHPTGDFLFPLLRNKFIWLPLYITLIFFILKKDIRSGLFFILCCAAGILLSDQLASSVIKPLFQRLRPCQLDNPEFPVRLVLEHCGSGYSFVSAHAANHFMLAGLLFYYFKINQISFSALWFVWAGCIGLSQVYVGVHYPGDILAGAILGIFVSLFMILIYRYCTRHFKIRC